MIYIDVDAAVEVPVNAIPLIDSTDFKSRETAIAYNEAGMDLVWNFVTPAGVISQTAVTPTTTGDYDWNHVGDAMYKIEIPASGGASINNNTEGVGYFSGLCNGVLPWRGPDIVFRASGINDLLIESPYSATRGLSGTALPDAAADAANGLIVSDLGGLDIDTLSSNVDAVLVDTGTTIPATITTAQNDLDILTGADGVNLLSATQASIDAIETDTNSLNDTKIPDTISLAAMNAQMDTALSDIHLDHLFAVDYDPASKPGTATALLNEMVESDAGVSRFTTNALENAPSGTGASAEAIADAVWDEAQADHVAAGSFGVMATELADVLVDTGTTIPATLTTMEGKIDTVDTVVDAVKVKTDQFVFTVANQVDANALTGGGGEDASTIYTYFTAGSREDLFKADVTALQGDLDILTGTDGVTLATSQPNYAPSTHSALSVWDVATASIVTASSIGLQLKTNVDAVLSNIETDTAEIGVAGAGLTAINLPDQTMNITGSITGSLSGSVGSVDGNVGGTVVLADSSSDAIIADAVWNALKASYGVADSYGEHLEGISGGGDASAASQTLIIEDLADIKGTGFAKDTHSLTNIEAYVDLIDDGTSGLAAIKTAIDSLNNLSEANILTQVNAALDTAIAELGVGAPSATPSVRTGLMLLYMALRNKTVVQTSGTDALEVFNDAGSKVASKLLTDDGSDYTEDKMS